MDPNRLIRFYVSFPADTGLPHDPEALRQRVLQIARRGCGRGEGATDPRFIESPSKLIQAPRALAELDTPPLEEVVAFEDTPQEAARLIRQLQQAGMAISAGIDLPMGPQSWWCPGQGPRQFGDRAEAERLIRAAGLRDPDRKGQVNLVIVDQGLPAEFPFPEERRDGWSVEDPVAKETREPFQGKGRHAAMVARNALAFVGTDNVKLWDCPLLPDRIDQLGVFLSYAYTAFGQLFGKIDAYRKKNGNSGSWVVVNAWGVWDTSQDDPDPALNYARNINHALNQRVAELDDKGVDQVFAAGNCGQFCPPTRCGPLDRGPGRSIHGANSHPKVLTVGAVRSDGLWVGYSAEGPGTLAEGKPDLCAPTLFREVLKPFKGEDNSGTSAACGVAAGVVAAARTRRPWNQMPPEALRAFLREHAAPQGNDPTSRSRFGAGTLNAAPVVTL
jgi:hypothetical protein